MRTELESSLEEFEAAKDEVLRRVAEVDIEKLGERPFEGKWSILEILEHLVVAEYETFHKLPDYSEVDEMTQSLRNRLMLRIVMFVLGRRIRVKVPAKAMEPKGMMTFETINERWDENHRWMRGFVDQLSDEELDRMYFAHPVAGPMDLAQSIELGRVHLRNHTEQIDKRLEALS